MVVLIELLSLTDPLVKNMQVCCDWSALQGWSEYFKLGLPAATMQCAEWWAFYSIILLAGMLGVQQ